LTKKAIRTELHRAVLLIRWSDGRDIAEIKHAGWAFRADDQIATHDAKDSTDVLDTVKAWVEGGRAQVLYIGAHGTPKGLTPARNSPVVLTWRRLASVLSKARQPIWVCLGACDSSFAAQAWEKEDFDFSVSVLFGFNTDETAEDELDEVLLKLLEVTGVYSSGSEEHRLTRERITTLEEDLSELKAASARLVVYRRMPGSTEYVEVTEAPENEAVVGEDNQITTDIADGDLDELLETQDNESDD
jgi:hypothetical protein